MINLRVVSRVAFASVFVLTVGPDDDGLCASADVASTATAGTRRSVDAAACKTHANTTRIGCATNACRRSERCSDDGCNCRCAL